MPTKILNKSIRLREPLFWDRTSWNPATLPLSGFDVSTNVVTRTRTGSGVPNWKGKIANKQNATSDLTGTYETLKTQGPETYTCLYDKDQYGFWGTSQGRAAKTYYDRETLDPAAYDLNTRSHKMLFNWGSNADGRASNQFLNKVRQEYTRFSAGSFFGEFKQTLTMLTHPAEALARSASDYVRQLTKRKLTRGRKWREAIPGMWLEYSFGWKPLMMDIQNAWDAANSLLEQQHLVEVKGSGKSQKMVSETDSWRQPVANYISYIGFKMHERTIETDYVKYYGAINVQAGTTSSERWARFGFTPDDFLPTAWEILPWSFLIDYFASIGDFVGGVCTRTGNVVWCSKVRRKESELYLSASPSLTMAPPAYSNMHLAGGSPTALLWKRVDIVRSASVGVPTPSLYLKTDGPTLGQWANISALFGQACVNLLPQQLSGSTYRLINGRPYKRP